MYPKDTTQIPGGQSQLRPISVVLLELSADRCFSWMSYLRPSLYRSYAVEERKLRDKPTTKPRTVRRVLEIPTGMPTLIRRSYACELVAYARSYTNLEIRTMAVAQPATNNKGRIIFGRTDPCIRIQYGRSECLAESIGPLCSASQLMALRFTLLGVP